MSVCAWLRVCRDERGGVTAERDVITARCAVEGLLAGRGGQRRTWRESERGMGYHCEVEKLMSEMAIEGSLWILV